MIPVPPYLDNLCQQFDVPLFDRFAMLRNGNDAGIATIFQISPRPGIAKRVHDCFGRAVSRATPVRAGRI